jgi:hypothetical protein
MLTELLTELHPSIVRTLQKGDTRAALELLAQAKNNRYYSELAQRILDTGFTAKTRLINENTLESLSNDPQVTESLNERIEALRDLVVTLYPQEQQAEIIAGLKSGELSSLSAALDTMRGTLKKNGGTQSNQQLLDSVEDLVNREFSWDGKYDPASDTIVIRRGEGRLTNHLLLHESIHAATSHLIDNADRLVGVQRGRRIFTPRATLGHRAAQFGHQGGVSVAGLALVCFAFELFSCVGVVHGVAGRLLVVWARCARFLACFALGVCGSSAHTAGLGLGAVGHGCLLSRSGRNCGPVYGHDAVFNACVFSAQCAA